MTGSALKSARLKANQTQQQAAASLGLTQAYLSMLEAGRRPVSSSLAARAAEIFDLPPTVLPLDAEEPSFLDEEQLRFGLGALGYPGFSYLRNHPKSNPAELLFSALDRPELDARVVEALPWLAATYWEMDWNWLTRKAKLNDLQNRLGFVVALAGELAGNASPTSRSGQFAEQLVRLDRSRLAREDTLCHDRMTQAERKWLRRNRSRLARRWNLLTDLEVRHLVHVPA